MRDECKHLLLPNIPKGKGLLNKRADYKDMTNHALYLEKLFSSAPLCIQEYMFELLGIDAKMKLLIQHKAGTKLRTLREIAHG